eukprot:gene46762-9499_t
MPGLSGHPPRRAPPGVAPYPSAQEFAESACRAADHVGALGFDAIGHSYGCALLVYLLRYAPELVCRQVFIECAVLFPGATIGYPRIFAKADSW